MKRAVFVLVLIAAACGGTPETLVDPIVHPPCGPLVVSVTNATPLQVQAVERALASWNALGFTRLTTQGEGHAVPLAFEKAAPFFHGFYDPESGKVYVNTGMTDETEIAVVAAHELGHAMGLPHIEERASVMQSGNLTIMPTPADSTALQGSCP